MFINSLSHIVDEGTVLTFQKTDGEKVSNLIRK